MSNNTGIYILKTKKGLGYEYRVKEIVDVDEYKWDNEIDQETDNKDIHIENAREMWADCEVHVNEATATAEAQVLLDKYVAEHGFCENGISEIYIPREF